METDAPRTVLTTEPCGGWDLSKVGPPHRLAPIGHDADGNRIWITISNTNEAIAEHLATYPGAWD